LLDPCGDAWSEHFLHDEDELVAQTPDAGYTAVTYDINDPVKVALRRDRREVIEESLHVLVTVPVLLEQLMGGIDFHPRPEQRLRLEIAEQLHKSLAAARRALIQLSAVPADASEDCACDRAACDLAGTVVAELLHIDLEPGRQ
jgi:hypothetical protein